MEFCANKLEMDRSVEKIDRVDRLERRFTNETCPIVAKVNFFIGIEEIICQSRNLTVLPNILF